MPQWIEAFLASEDGQQAVQDGEQLVIPSGLLKAFLKAQGMDCSPSGLGRLYEEAGAQRSIRRLGGKRMKVIVCPSQGQAAVHREADAAVHREADAAVHREPAEAVHREAEVAVHRAQEEAVHREAVEGVHRAQEEAVHREAVEGVHRAQEEGVHREPTTTIDDEPTRLSPADQELVEQHGLERVMGPHKTLIWEAPMNASRATRMIAIRLNNPDLFAEESPAPTGGTAAAATQESELEDASSKTARVLLPGGEIVELRDGLAPVSVLEHLPPGTELEGDKPCRIKGREGVWHLHATRAREDGSGERSEPWPKASGIDALVLSPDRTGVLTVDLFGEVELIEQPDDGYQVKVIGNDGQVVDPVTGEIEGPHAPEQAIEQVQPPASAPAPASPVALKEIDPAVLQKLPGDAKREGDVLCGVPGHPEQWKLHATRKRPDGGVNALLVATQGNRVVVVDRAAVELVPPPAAPPAKKVKKRAAPTGPEDQLDRAANGLAKKFKGEVVEEAVAA